MMTYNSSYNPGRHWWLASSTGISRFTLGADTDWQTYDVKLFAKFSRCSPARYYHTGTMGTGEADISLLDPMSIRGRKIWDDFLRGRSSHRVLADFSSHQVFISHPLIKKHMASQHRAHPFYCLGSKSNWKSPPNPKWPILRMFLRIACEVPFCSLSSCNCTRVKWIGSISGAATLYKHSIGNWQLRSIKPFTERTYTSISHFFRKFVGLTTV